MGLACGLEGGAALLEEALDLAPGDKGRMGLKKRARGGKGRVGGGKSLCSACVGSSVVG